MRLPCAISSPALRRVVVLATVGALGVGIPCLHLVRRTPRHGGDGAAWADARYSGLARTLRAGERIGVIVASGDPDLDGALSMCAQYALAPAIVEPIYLSDCLRDGGPRCRLERVDRVAALEPPPPLVGILERRLGLVPTSAVDSVLLLEKRGR